MQDYGFDRFESRVPWNQTKWDPDVLKDKFGDSDVLPAWIADMDFKTPPAVQEAVVRAAQHGIYGYTGVGKDVIQSYLNWQSRRNNWQGREEWLRFTPGVVSAVNLLLLSQTDPGDEVLIQRPVYYPFFHSIRQQERTVVNSPLVYRDGRYEIDFEDFARKAASPKCRAFILCSPHNPVGRVFTAEELRRLGEICLENGVFVIADEIHSDLIFPGRRHTVFASLSDAFAENCAICHAPSKTFNLAGLAFSCISIPNQRRREQFDAMAARYGQTRLTFFAPVAAKAAWDGGEEWLDACLAYIRGNYNSLADFLAKTWPGRVSAVPLEGTYLAWVDFRQLEPDPKKLEQIMTHKAKVALDEGYIFGPEGNGFERINLAAPRTVIEQILSRIAAAFQ